MAVRSNLKEQSRKSGQNIGELGYLQGIVNDGKERL